MGTSKLQMSSCRRREGSRGIHDERPIAVATLN